MIGEGVAGGRDSVAAGGSRETKMSLFSHTFRHSTGNAAFAVYLYL